MSKTHLHKDFVLPILVSQQSQRQNYVFELVFNELIRIDYQICTEEPENNFLSYGLSTGVIAIPQHGYLYQKSVEQPVFEEVELSNKVFPFASQALGFDFPFDIFSTIFYFVSRHEEYHAKDLDEHGRFKSQNSWLTQKDWLKTPIVNFLVDMLRIEITTKFHVEIPKNDDYTIEPTIDIDNAYAFCNREKTLLPSIVKSLLSFNLSEAIQKSKNDKENDPFNTHKELIRFVTRKNWNPKVFFLMKSGGKDSINNIAGITEVIKQYKKSGIEVGLHPSYNSNEALILEEKQKLEKVINQIIVSSRHHFIQNLLPKSYNELLAVGISNDHSMGYARQNGFRAGICHSFYWFDLEKDTKTTLRVTPFCFMDATFIHNLKKTPEDATLEMFDFLTTVKQYGGVYSFIFHNESLSNNGIYEGWGKVWNDLFKKLE